MKPKVVLFTMFFGLGVSVAVLAQNAVHSEKQTYTASGHALQCVTNSTEAGKCQEVAQQLNQYRQSFGIAALAYDYRLEECEEGHCHHMVQHNFFSHYGPDPTNEPQSADPWKRAAACGTSANGENIAAGYVTSTDVMNAWKNSPGHDANMRNTTFTRVGVGYYYGSASTYRYYWGQLFGVGAVTQATHANAGSSSMVATPTITPNGGTFTGSVSVTPACATAGATIRYSTDGSAPSIVYSGPFTLTANATVRCKASLTGYTDSAEASAVFTVTSASQTVAAPVINPWSGNTYKPGTAVYFTVSEATAGASVYLTLGGAEPTLSSFKYPGGWVYFTMGTSPATVKAKAYLNGVWSTTTTVVFNPQ
jgi:uncharacterized protein YkwD